jgi:purine-binding chemotaxis protein CheW
VISLRPEDVKWRGSQGRRPWLAGTVIQQMCALLEVDAFLEQLGEANHGKAMA